MHSNCPPQRHTYRLRQQHSVPLLVSFKAWLEEQAPQVLPESLLGKTISYTLNQWKYLGRYVSGGRAPVDNNWIHTVSGMTQVVADGPTAVLDVADQLRPLHARIGQSFAEQTFRYDAGGLLEHQRVNGVEYPPTSCAGSPVGNRSRVVEI